MEGTLLANRPAFPIHPTKPTSHPNHQRLKFNTSILALPTVLPHQQQRKQKSPSSHSLPVDSLLQHLLHISTSVSSQNQDSLPPHFMKGNGLLDFLPLKCKFILRSILEQPICDLNAFFDSVKFELLQEVDLISLLKGLDVSGNWEKAILLFEWVLLNFDGRKERLDNQVIELIVKVVGKESHHFVTTKLFVLILYEDYTLDVRTWTTILHAFSRIGKYEKAITLFDFIKKKGLSPNLVTYNVMLDVYGKKGRSWDQILGLLDEMRSSGLEFDEFTCSTVISACK